ncbi:hypothetical protein HP567_029670 (plasmid) [Brevibacillus sp. M2.1A]|uniref:hypothetical protein n=1 Tax=Brevibacillus sp. M2.1A TaxID=2738980 RepID=UPI00156B6343|nr:hypothetical protein [Brevibacillus sp. M2.1A]MCC8438705.1 hypothetical protein [Brevibacillus sp. M2.1A]
MRNPGNEQMVYLCNLLYDAGFALTKDKVTMEQYIALVDFIWDDKSLPKKWETLIEFDTESTEEDFHEEDLALTEENGEEQGLTILEKCIEAAEASYDGHLTILRFTSNWRCCFGTLMDVNPYTTAYMAEGKTIEEALEKTLKYHYNAYDIQDAVDEEQESLV